MGGENRQRELVSQYRTLLETSIDGFFVNVAGRFRYVNPALVRLLGAANADELLGREVFDFIAPSSHAAVKRRIAEMRRSAAPVEPLEERYVRVDGREIDVEISAVAIIEGGEHAMLVTVRDISQRKQSERTNHELEAQLRHAQKMEALGTLAGGIAHDFNNVLAAVIGNAELLLQQCGDNVRLLRYAENILAAAERARGVTHQVLTFSRRQASDKSVIDLRAAVLKELPLLRAGAPGDVRIEVRLTDEPCPVRADITQIHQVLLNLCSNSWQVMDSTGHITIGLEKRTSGAGNGAGAGATAGRRYAVLSVTDDGPGIEPDVQPRMFDPFFTTKPAGQGTGLGLSVVDGIIREHGGHIRVESRPGEGAVFWIYLPLLSTMPTEMEETAPDDATSPQHESPVVLLVDDEVPILEVTSLLLRTQGYRVVAENRPKDALEQLAHRPQDFDILLTDLKMPGMTGLELARQAKDCAPHLVMLLFSGFADADVEAEAAKIGIAQVLQKPLVTKELVAAVRGALQQARTK